MTSVMPGSSRHQQLALSCCCFLLGDCDRRVYIHIRQQGGGMEILSSTPPPSPLQPTSSYPLYSYTKKIQYHFYVANPCSTHQCYLQVENSLKPTSTCLNYKQSTALNTSAPEICVYIYIKGLYLPLKITLSEVSILHMCESASFSISCSVVLTASCTPPHVRSVGGEGEEQGRL